MIDVLMLARNDWANTGYRFSKCLELLGLRVLYIKGCPHAFGYPVQAPIDVSLSWMHAKYPVKVNAPHYGQLAQASRAIHYIATSHIDTGIDLTKKKVVVQHGGSTYRIEPKLANDTFNSFADAAIIQCPDLLNLGANNEHLIYYPVDTQLIKPHYRTDAGKILVGHFPSSPANKGTSKILEVIRKMQQDPSISEKFEYVGVTNPSGNQHQVSWQQNLERMKNCDIIIETHQPNLKLDGRESKVFGEWGNTAIEAASLGKSVITNSLTSKIYSKEYGDMGLHIANDEETLTNNLYELIGLGRKKLLEDGEKTRNWVVENHSMEATAVRLWDKIYSNFFPEKWADTPPTMNNLHTDSEPWCETVFENNRLVDIKVKK
jgi:hypothetical protein